MTDGIKFTYDDAGITVGYSDDGVVIASARMWAVVPVDTAVGLISSLRDAVVNREPQIGPRWALQPSDDGLDLLFAERIGAQVHVIPLDDGAALRLAAAVQQAVDDRDSLLHGLGRLDELPMTDPTDDR